MINKSAKAPADSLLGSVSLALHVKGMISAITAIIWLQYVELVISYLQLLNLATIGLGSFKKCRLALSFSKGLKAISLLLCVRM
ncbi:hypothetical protein A9Q90_05105 [Gammaproteobacteria bacterium 54_18_T64]|nr:hypothetical protein A9Q90_05105 [Gammaproteobacteria bacterium 54_18_T64]